MLFFQLLNRSALVRLLLNLGQAKEIAEQNIISCQRTVKYERKAISRRD